MDTGVFARPTRAASTDAPADGGFEFVHDEDDPLRKRLVALLRSQELRAATEIIEVEDIGGALEANADLLIRPRLKKPASIQLEGWNVPEAYYSLAAWATTWWFGTVMGDRKFKAEFAVDLDIIDPHANRTLSTVESESTDFDLNLWDRNPWNSWGALASLVLPPFVNVLDDPGNVSASVSRKIHEAVARDLTRWLKEDLASVQRARLGDILIEQPVNGSVVDGATVLRGEIVALEPIQGVRVLVDERAQPLPSGTSIQESRQRVGGEYRMPLPAISVPFAQGQTRQVAIEVDLGLRRMSRTICVRGVEVSQ